MTAADTSALSSLSGKSPHRYTPHALHDPGRSYQESNCYTDSLIELLHAHGYEPLAMFGHLVRMDFEGDQWTFFKPPPHDLERLYGIDIHEMQPYRPLALQIAEQLEEGRTIIVELDSWFMPDTASTSYRCEHVKTSVAADAIALDSERLWYFHGTGFWELSGDDYRGILRIDESDAPVLPPYTELARFDAGVPLQGEALREASVELLSSHLARRPADNPFERFGAQLRSQLPVLLAEELDMFHAYAFATVRMAGSGFEILGSHASWLFGADADQVVAATGEIVDSCKALSFRLARRREFDPQKLTEALAAGWDRTISGLLGLAG